MCPGGTAGVRWRQRRRWERGGLASDTRSSTHTSTLITSIDCAAASPQVRVFGGTSPRGPAKFWLASAADRDTGCRCRRGAAASSNKPLGVPQTALASHGPLPHAPPWERVRAPGAVCMPGCGTGRPSPGAAGCPASPPRPLAAAAHHLLAPPLPHLLAAPLPPPLLLDAAASSCFWLPLTLTSAACASLPQERHQQHTRSASFGRHPHRRCTPTQHGCQTHHALPLARPRRAAAGAGLPGGGAARRRRAAGGGRRVLRRRRAGGQGRRWLLGDAAAGEPRVTCVCRGARLALGAGCSCADEHPLQQQSAARRRRSARRPSAHPGRQPPLASSRRRVASQHIAPSTHRLLLLHRTTSCPRPC